jgi:hypothetical protein
MRDMHSRMKETLVHKGIFPRATVRPPQLRVSGEGKRRVRAALEVGGLLQAKRQNRLSAAPNAGVKDSTKMGSGWESLGKLGAVNENWPGFHPRM